MRKLFNILYSLILPASIILFLVSIIYSWTNATILSMFMALGWGAIETYREETGKW